MIKFKLEGPQLKAPIRRSKLTECADYDPKHRSTVNLYLGDPWGRSHGNRVGTWIELNSARKWDAQQEMLPLLSKKERSNLQGKNPAARKIDNDLTDKTLAALRNAVRRMADQQGVLNAESDREINRIQRQVLREQPTHRTTRLVWIDPTKEENHEAKPHKG